MEHLELYKNKKGFTLIETIVVMGIIITLFGISVGVFMGFRQGNELNSDTENLVSNMRLAQNESLSGREFRQHGIYFNEDENEYVLFKGSEYDPGDEDNEVTALDETVEFFNIQLAGDGDSVVFERISGATANHGFIELADAYNTEDRRIICVQENGTVERLDHRNKDAAECMAGDIEHISANNDDDVINFPSSNAQGDPAQSFVSEEDAKLAHVSLFIGNESNDGDDLSDVFLEIREDSTVGSVAGRSLVVEGESIPDSLSWVQFSFPVAVELVEGEIYYIRLRSLPSSTNNNPGAEGSIVWGYSNGNEYVGGSAWSGVGANNIPTAQGNNMTNTDFGFKIFTTSSPDILDSRHLEFDLGFSLQNRNNISLSFAGGAVTETISIDNYMGSGGTIFRWEDSVEVGGEEQKITINSVYIDESSTILSVYRDRRFNSESLNIAIDGDDVVSYDADGTPNAGSGVESMIYR